MTVYSVQGLQQEQRSFEPIPAGIYNAIVADVDFGSFNSGQGYRLNITYEVTDGEYRNRKIFDTIALQHPNAEWAQATQARLDALMLVNNIQSIDDWSQLRDLQCGLKVYIQKSKDPAYSDKNQVDLVIGVQKADSPNLAANRGAAPKPIEERQAPAPGYISGGHAPAAAPGPAAAPVAMKGFQAPPSNQAVAMPGAPAYDDGDIPF